MHDCNDDDDSNDAKNICIILGSFFITHFLVTKNSITYMDNMQLSQFPQVFHLTNVQGMLFQSKFEKHKQKRLLGFSYTMWSFPARNVFIFVMRKIRVNSEFLSCLLSFSLLLCV